MNERVQTRSIIPMWGRLVWVGVVTLVFVGFGCVTTSNTKKTPTTINIRKALKLKDYFPLKVGDKRVYRVRFARQVRTREQIVRVIRQQGRRFFDDQKQYYEYDAYGLRSNRRYLLKYPLRVGTRWLSVVNVTNVERNMIVDVNRTVTTPAGVYNKCIVVRSRDSQGRRGVLEGVFYFAPRVGLAKISTVLESQGRRIPQWTLELISYTAGKKGDSASATAMPTKK